MTTGERAYYFEVRETIIRIAEVRASSAKEARALLDAWSDPQDKRQLAGDSCDHVPIQLSDLESVAVSYRNVKAPQ